MKSPRWTPFAKATDIAPGGHLSTTLGNLHIAVFRIGEALYAILDSCPHQHLPISSGMIDGEEIECPFHGARFCLRTGAVTAPPAFEGLTCYEVREQDGMIEVLV